MGIAFFVRPADNARMAKKKRKKPGPPKTKGKDPTRSLRVPAVEWDAWKRRATKAGKTISMWLRSMANRDDQ